MSLADIDPPASSVQAELFSSHTFGFCPKDGASIRVVSERQLAKTIGAGLRNQGVTWRFGASGRNQLQTVRPVHCVKDSTHRIGCTFQRNPATSRQANAATHTATIAIPTRRRRSRGVSTRGTVARNVTVLGRRSFNSVSALTAVFSFSRPIKNPQEARSEAKADASISNRRLGLNGFSGARAGSRMVKRSAFCFLSRSVAISALYVFSSSES